MVTVAQTPSPSYSTTLTQLAWASPLEETNLRTLTAPILSDWKSWRIQRFTVHKHGRNLIRYKNSATLPPNSCTHHGSVQTCLPAWIRKDRTPSPSYSTAPKQLPWAAPLEETSLQTLTAPVAWEAARRKECSVSGCLSLPPRTPASDSQGRTREESPGDRWPRRCSIRKWCRDVWVDRAAWWRRCMCDLPCRWWRRWSRPARSAALALWPGSLGHACGCICSSFCMKPSDASVRQVLSSCLLTQLHHLIIDVGVKA